MSFAGAAVVLLVGAAFFAYEYVVHGGMSARWTPPALERVVAWTAVDLGIPDDARTIANPLGSRVSDADLSAGRALYRANCEVCHAADGAARTSAGSGLYPRASNLRADRTRRRTDGAIFYLIRSGIRNTGMPAWNFTDRQTWQLVSYVRNLPHTAGVTSAVAGKPGGGFVGSAACAACHRAIYDRWQKTLMANVVRDPRQHPDAIIPDLSKPNKLVNFTVDDIAFVYGSKWKQRYFKKVGDDYFPLGAQWDVTHKLWKPYFVKEDWWAQDYPPDNTKRPTGPTCDGCHSVNYDVSTKHATEWNVGCEKCHGPGGEHAEHPTIENIFNPGRADYVQANDACVQCHSQGRPKTNPIGGRYYDWPVGFEVGKRLADFWSFEPHKLGETTFTHFADGTAHKNRMQGNDFVQSLMYARGVTCATCHDPHGSANNAMLRKPAEQLCLDCHSPGSANGPRAATLEEHTHHKAGSAGSSCVECHMPKIATTLGDVKVRSHTFHFVPPDVTESSNVPNACNVCHADKSVEWTLQQLSAWAGESPWRVAQPDLASVPARP